MLARAATCAALLLVGCGGNPAAGSKTTSVPVDPVEAEPERAPAPAVVDIEAGGDTVCARRDDGAVFCWGDLYRGHATWPQRVAGLPPVKALSVGEDHSCAVDVAGDLWCWGAEDASVGSWDQLVGEGWGEPAVPHRIAGVEKLRAVSVGGGHNGSVARTCVIGEDDVLTCMRWERDQRRYDELGKVDDVDVGYDLACVLKQGVHHCADLRGDRFLPTRFRSRSGATGLRSVVVSDASHCGHTDDGHLFCWGPRYCREHRRPHRRVGQPKPPRHGPWNRWRDQRACEVTASTEAIRSLAGSNTGLVAARAETVPEWFIETSGRYGERVWDKSFVEVTAGRLLACGLTRSGEVVCWGINGFGQLGRQNWPLGRRYRVPLAQVVARDDQVCAVDPEAGVRCWVEAHAIGMGDAGWLRGETIIGTRGAKDMFVNDKGICIDLGTGPLRCTSDARGTLSGWPMEAFQTMGGHTACSVHDGQLRCRFDAAEPTPITIDDKPLLGVMEVGLDMGGGYARTGEGLYSFEGDGKATRIQGMGTPEQIAVGRAFLCVLGGGRVRCRGRGSDGQLGDGTGRSSGELRDVKGLPPVIRVRAGVAHACAVTRDGRLYCWGSNAFGQLGDGTRWNRWVATEVPGLTGVKDVSPGHRGTCASLDEESICWGRRAALSLDPDPKAARNLPQDEMVVVEGIGAPAPTVAREQLDVVLPTGAEPSPP